MELLDITKKGSKFSHITNCTVLNEKSGRFLPRVAFVAIASGVVTAYFRPMQDITAIAIGCIAVSMILVAIFGDNEVPVGT